MFKILLGETAEEDETAAPSDAKQEQDQESSGGEMATIKMEPQDLESMMTRAMASAVVAARESQPAQSPSAQVGAAVDEVNAVTAQPLKIAGFWEDDPETWFMRGEMQFMTRKITSDESKFAHIVQALDKNQTKEVKSLMRDPPKGASYNAIKKALIQAFETTQLEKDNKLLGMLTLGDRDPRSMIRELRALNKNPETLLRAVVINMLPQDVRSTLSSLPSDATLEDIGEHAFKTIDLRKERKAINAIRRRAKERDPSDSEDEEVNAVQRKGKSDRRPERVRGRDRDREEGANFVCFAHKKFGPKAYTCKPGCSFESLPLAQRGAGNSNAGR